MPDATAPRPNLNTFWVIPGKFLAGEYPGDKELVKAREKINRFLEVGVRHFVDLTELGELVPYEAILSEESRAASITATYQRFPIRDVGVPRDAAHLGEILLTILEAITEEHFHRHFNINVLGLLLVTQAAVKYLGEGGCIINIGSVASRITSPNSAVYSGTKAAVDAITIVLSRELGPKKIRVNTLSPGIVETEGTHSGGFIGSEFEKFALAQTPLGRIGQPSDIASIAVFLASEDSAWLTGERLLASGGFR